MTTLQSKKSLLEKLNDIARSPWGNLMLSALVGAITAGAVTAVIESTNRRIQYKPHLTFGLTKLTSDPTQQGIVMRNLGNGPAIIEETYLYINDKEPIIVNQNYKNNFISEFLQKTGIDKTCSLFISSQGILSTGDGIHPNTENAFITIPSQVTYTETYKGLDTLSKITSLTAKIQQKPDLTDVNNYLISEAYNQCKKSFSEFFASENTKFEIGVRYRSLAEDGEIYGVDTQGNIKKNPIKIFPIPHTNEIITEFLKSKPEITQFMMSKLK